MTRKTRIPKKHVAWIAQTKTEDDLLAMIEAATAGWRKSAFRRDLQQSRIALLRKVLREHPNAHLECREFTPETEVIGTWQTIQQGDWAARIIGSSEIKENQKHDGYYIWALWPVLEGK